MALELRRLDRGELRIRSLGYPAGARMPRHAHHYANVTAVITGAIEETTDDEQHRGLSGSVLIKPAGTDHSNVILGRKGTITTSIEVAADSPLGREIFEQGWSWHEDPACATAALALYRATADESEARAYDLVAVALASAKRRSATAPKWLDEVLATLEQRFALPLRFDDIARETGLHPVYLSRAFHRFTGVSMGDHLRAIRLRHARHLLASTERSVSSIAAETGFADPSHLSRTFTEAHEMNPRSFRRAVTG
jgi:AraC family transcriptional regulator